MPNRVVAGLDPPCPVAIVADRSFAPEADEIDLGVPLPVSPTDRTFRIQGPVSRLERDDVESVGAVWSVAIDDVAGMGDWSSPRSCRTKYSRWGFRPTVAGCGAADGGSACIGYLDGTRDYPWVKRDPRLVCNGTFLHGRALSSLCSLTGRTGIRDAFDALDHRCHIAGVVAVGLLAPHRGRPHPHPSGDRSDRGASSAVQRTPLGLASERCRSENSRRAHRTAKSIAASLTRSAIRPIAIPATTSPA